MKMESAKLCELLAASFLIFVLLTDPTTACMCAMKTAMQTYCSHSFLLLAQVHDVIDNSEKYEMQYKIKVTKVLKGPKSLKRFQNLYTASVDSLCGYEHPTPFNEEEYLFSVRRYGDRLSTTLCDFNVKWDSLTEEEQEGFSGGFKGMCD